MTQVFEMIPPAGPAYAITAAATVVLLVGLAGFLAYVFHSSSQVRFEVSSEELRIRGGLYGRSIPLEDLVLDEAKVVDLRTETRYALSWRTNGIRVPGYQAGWHRMRKGGKALVFVTDRQQVVFLPTRRNYSLLLSAASPHEFLGALHAAAR